MMSATTAFTETPAATPGASAVATTGAPGGAGAANEFQNLLAGAVIDGASPALDALLPGPAPGQTIAQLLAPKSPAAVRQPPPLQLIGGAEVSAGEMLELLNQSATLLPEASPTGSASPEELLETHETAKVEDDVLSDWLNIMIPYSVLAPQAGSQSGAISATGQGDAGTGRANLAAIPSSLQHQAGNAEGLLPDAASTDASTPTVVALERPAAAQSVAAPGAALAALAALTAVPQNNTETRDGAATGDEWMNAFGDLTAKRTPDVGVAPAPRLMMPVHDARWADALAHRLVMMAREGESVAQLRLIPQELGPLDIQISVRDGEATVHFGAAHAETRSALEASLPRLRELLAAQGLQLANASVSHQSANGGRPDRPQTVSAVSAIAEEAEAAPGSVMNTSLLDIYA